MLQNAYLLAKIGVDTAENEQHFAEKLPHIGNYLRVPAVGREDLLDRGPPEEKLSDETAQAGKALVNRAAGCGQFPACKERTTEGQADRCMQAELCPLRMVSRNIASIAPNWLNSSHWSTKENKKTT